MNQDVKKNRQERLALWSSLAVSGGLVSTGDVAWLLDCSTTFVRRLVRLGRLPSVGVAGQRRIFFSGVLQYCKTTCKEK